jgi:hypothetical protein
MEKIASKQINMKLRDMVELRSSGYTLVHASDKRPAAIVDPKTEFDMIKGESSDTI